MFRTHVHGCLSHSRLLRISVPFLLLSLCGSNPIQPSDDVKREPRVCTEIPSFDIVTVSPDEVCRSLRPILDGKQLTDTPRVEILRRYTGAMVQQGKLNEAFAEFRELHELDPSDIAASCVYEALRWMQFEDIDALKTLERIAERNPESAVPLVAIAMCYHVGKNQQPKTTIAYATRALQIQPDCYDALAVRSFAHKAMREWSKCFEDASRAVLLVPGIFITPDDVWMVRGASQMALNDYNGALASFVMSLRLDPTSAPSLMGICKAYSEMGKFDAAIRAADRLVALREEEVAGHLAAIETRMEAGRTQEGVTLAWKATKRFPNEASVLALYGKCLLAAGGFDEGMRCLDQAISKNPNYAKALAVKAQFLIGHPDDAKRDPAVAMQLAKRACELTKWQDWNMVFIYASTLSELGQTQEAIRWLEHCESLPPVSTGTDSVREYLRTWKSKFRAGERYRLEEVQRTADLRQ